MIVVCKTMTNYTPLDIEAFKRVKRLPPQKPMSRTKKPSPLDTFLLPFSIFIFVASLSFYAVKLAIDISTNAGSAAPARSTPQKILTEVRPSVVAENDSSALSAAVLERIGTYTFASEALFQSARTTDASTPEPALIMSINDDLYRWAALRTYFADTPNSTPPAQLLKTDQPIATYGAVLSEMASLTKSYTAIKTADIQPLESMIQAFIKANPLPKNP